MIILRNPKTKARATVAHIYGTKDSHGVTVTKPRRHGGTIAGDFHSLAAALDWCLANGYRGTGGYPMLQRAPFDIEVPCVRNGKPGYRWAQGWNVIYHSKRVSAVGTYADTLRLLQQARKEMQHA